MRRLYRRPGRSNEISRFFRHSRKVYFSASNSTELTRRRSPICCCFKRITAYRSANPVTRAVCLRFSTFLASIHRVMSALARGNDSRLYRFFFLPFSPAPFPARDNFLPFFSVLIPTTGRGHYFVPERASQGRFSPGIRRLKCGKRQPDYFKQTELTT